MITPRENAVVMACDANYAPYAFFMAKQIDSAHPGRDFDICIFSHDEIKMPDGLSELDVNIEFIAGESPFRNSLNPSRHSDATYLRLLLPELVSNRYKRLLYLDSDIYVSGTGINRLFALDMLEAPLAAVRDNTQWRTPRRLVPEFKILGLPYAPYFNAGVLLIDVKRYRSEGILAQCLQLLNTYPEALLRHDQSLLNLVLRGRWTELSPVWNWQYTWSSRFFADLAEPKLIHFIGPRKPWKDNSNHLPSRFRSAYKKFLVMHFPNRPHIVPIDADSLGWPESLRRTFFKHLLSVVPMKRYLDRFHDDLVVHKAV